MKIESGIPFNSSRDIGAMGRWRGLLAEMNVGDSFAYPSSARSAVSVAIYRHRESGRAGKFSYAKQDIGYRVWRIE